MISVKSFNLKELSKANVRVCVCVYIYIYIISSSSNHTDSAKFWHTHTHTHTLSLSLSPSPICSYRSSLLTGLLDCILCPNRANESSFWSANTRFQFYRKTARNFLPELFPLSGYITWCNDQQAGLADHCLWLWSSLGAPHFRSCITSKLNNYFHHYWSFSKVLLRCKKSFYFHSFHDSAWQQRIRQTLRVV